jgi:uncharacterized protein (DUF2235 family)
MFTLARGWGKGGTVARNLVLLLDGTSNEVKEDLTNVLKLYRSAVRDESQRVFYGPGIGTVPLVSDWNPLAQRAAAVFGLATGWGLDDNLIAAYRHLAEAYREGDRIFLFGFSRGAYTARALAGMIHLLGLFEPEQMNLVPYALTAYKRDDRAGRLNIAWRFRRVIGGRRVPIWFLGVWDTVASILTRSGAFSLPSLTYLPYTKSNPSVQTFRQAAAIDERRSMFRLYRWPPGKEFKPDPFGPDGPPQDERTVWFAGSHSDVGGGHAESESQIAKLPLIWLAREAEACGLRINQSLFAHVAEGRQLPDGRHLYVAPDPLGPIHDSLTCAWWPLEFLPKGTQWKRFPEKTGSGGFYLPRGEPRKIDDGAFLHSSVIERKEKMGYAPINLPKVFEIADTREAASPAP